MIVIADNLNTRNKAYMSALKAGDKKTIISILNKISHADMINIQCSLDGSGDRELLPWIVEVVQEALPDCHISLDSRDTLALEKAISVIKNPPLINYISATEPEEPEPLLDLVAGSNSSLVLRASRVTPPASLEAKLQILEELLEMANAADIPNERLFADPSLVHVGRGVGQRHLSNSAECIRVIKELVDPPLGTIAWISNVSAGLPPSLKKTVEASYFFYLSGAGLDAAMIDVVDDTLKRAIYLVKAFRDETVFTPADLA